MDSRLPLSALLSQALVAFTIEFDNEFEHRTPHRTTNHGATPGSRKVPWLVSMVMWAKFLRFVPDDGITARELLRLTRIDRAGFRMWLKRLAKWWSYLRIEPPTPAKKEGVEATRPKSRAEWIVRPTEGGHKAIEVWRPLTGVIERRWQERFGKSAIEDLKASLRALIDQMDFEPAASLPILVYGLFTKGADRNALGAPDKTAEYESTLPALLSKTLLAFAIEFESDSDLSLAISANVLRLIDEPGVSVANLPRLAGISKEAVATSLSYLEKHGYARLPPARKSRGKQVTLTVKGFKAKEAYRALAEEIEDRWKQSFGKERVRSVRQSLEHLTSPEAAESRLLAGLKPYPESWRATLAPISTLPHYPMILHRGGYPDGA